MHQFESGTGLKERNSAFLKIKAYNSVEECHSDKMEAVGSNPTSPTEEDLSNWWLSSLENCRRKVCGFDPLIFRKLVLTSKERPDEASTPRKVGNSEAT